MGLFQILDISSDDVNINGESKFIITLYGKSDEVNEEGFNKNVVCHVEGFKPYFYLKYPDHWGNSFIRNSFLCDRFLNIDEYIYDRINSEVINSYELYGYHLNEDSSEKTFKFIKLEFITHDNMKKSIRKIKEYCNNSGVCSDEDVKKSMEEFIDLSNNNDNRMDSNLYESNIHPVLRFIHEKNIKTCGWVEVKNEKLVSEDDKIFNTELEYKNIRLSDINPVDVEDINKFIIASFDIECDSLHGDFPNPNKDFKKLSVDITDYYKICDYYNTDVNSCKSVLFQCVNGALNGGIDYINSIELENGPISDISKNKVIEDNLECIHSLLINSKENSKMRDHCVNELNNIFKEFKNDDKKLVKVLGDPVIQIGTVFHRYGDSQPYDRSIVVMGPEEGMEDSEICEDLNGINVYRCSDEKELLLKWKDLILKHNPDYITGYNIFGFDFDYIIKRVEKIFECTHKNCKYNHFTQSKHHHFTCESHAFYRLGRLMKKNDKDYCKHINLDGDTITDKMVHSKYFKYKTKKCCTVTKRLGGFNDKVDDKNDFAQNTLKYINMDGRIIFDVQNEVKKGTSLDSYKLDNVAAHFMRGKIIKKLRHKELSTWIETNNVGNLKDGDYISISITTKYGEMKYNNGEKFIVRFAGKKSIRIKGVLNYIKKYGDNFVKAEWCLNKDDISPQELFDAHKVLDPIEGPKGRARIAKYCIMDCELCIHLLLLLDFIPNNMGMASVCYVPQPYIFLRGQGIKVQSLVTKYSNDNNIRVPSLKQFDENTDDNSGFEGAIVLEPKTGMYLDDPIAVLDYASLYPTSIKEKNLSHDTYFGEYGEVKDRLDSLGWSEKDDYNRIKYKDYIYETKPGTSVVEKNPVMIETTDENGNTKEEHKEIDCVFLTPKKKKGIISIVVSALLEQRSATKKLLKKEKNEDKKKVLDGYQLAYKLTANSVYGQLGAKTSSISFKKVAACTTAIGRDRIYDAKDLVTKWTKENIWKDNIDKNKEFYDGVTDISSEVVYGDTDSIFVKFIIEKGTGKRLYGKDALPICIQCGKDSGIYITQQLHMEDKAPQDLEYEKTFYPFILISKKRYTGEKYEMTSDETPKRTSMGLVTKRRDNAPIVKYVFGNLINKLMYDKNLGKTLDWLKYILKRIMDGKEHISMFMLSKTLNSYYKNPQSIPHKVLADRIGERDPGNKPKANDRIPYAFIKADDSPIFMGYKMVDKKIPTGERKMIKKKVDDGFYKNGNPKTKTINVPEGEMKYKISRVPEGEAKYKKRIILQGDRIEHPDFIKQNNIELDYKYYISNQIMNPVKQVLDINMNPDESRELFNKFLQ
jgi:DNA polymerase elongation subunit (family B)